MSGTPASAMVDVLTAEVRVLMVGKRQVTLSVFKQLDVVPDGPDTFEPFGRVSYDDRTRRDRHVWAVGRTPDGALARAVRERDYDDAPHRFNEPTTPRKFSGVWAVVPSAMQRPLAAVVRQRGAYKVAWKFRSDQICEDDSLKPGTWKWINLAVQRECEIEADDDLDGVELRIAALRAWEQLPLIVLAGLR